MNTRASRPLPLLPLFPPRPVPPRFPRRGGFTLIERMKDFRFSIPDSRFPNDQASVSVIQWRGSAQSKIENPESKISRASRAFTLIELLTVIAIIGILAAIIIPVVGKVRSAAAAAQCKSVLRGNGMAIQLFIDDNKGKLPGRCMGGVSRAQNQWHLYTYLAPYIGLQPGAIVPDDLLCLGYRRNARNLLTNRGISIWSLMNEVKVDEHGATASPWGYGPTPPEGSPDPQPPRTYQFISLYNTYSQTGALTDIDRVNHGADASIDDIPQKPVHGNYRNVLFFDWHIAARKVP
ncbi:MAG: prepilin-type N-terminal cleavage/methylation domain-containing protein [Opitutaceae bacterium]|jgi:prepilin-type N-terminal cleavage/methylation domain-containing protein/prepilin-type processing-associated H-X9-DG protein|nr:prepilin-type N-terminal cleavage/methylation domain-containing protein [Opitutaceae bacterium]